jgi:hypothetical protein
MTGPLVVVAGAMANKPGNGGEAWVRASWVRGLARLGCEVLFVEEIEAGACVDPDGGPPSPGASVNRRWFDAAMAYFGWIGRSALVSGPETISGGWAGDVGEALRQADLLVNISGNLRSPQLRDVVSRRVYVDIDPGFTQLWMIDGQWAGQPEAHDVCVTVGANIGSDRCRLPTSGLEWRYLPPPVVLEDWPLAAAHDSAASIGEGFTTVASWRGPFGPIEWEGRRLGSKVREFRRFAVIPSRVDTGFELALDIHSRDEADRMMLLDRGWKITDPRVAAGTPAAFHEYIQRSGAEFSVAQTMYVQTASGWFSDRSTRYLSSGRPVLLQDTGTAGLVPGEKGLVTFRTVDEAVAGAERILSDYQSHAAAARRTAEEFFDSDRVLSAFLSDCLP